MRRYYPFTPLLGARVRVAFTWRGHRFEPGMLVLLDVHGIDHDERLWADPHAFQPERFAHWDGSAFSLVPQGGGEHFDGHRCAGEWLTLETLKTTALLLATAMTYEVPAQDLRIDLTRMPTLPASGFLMRQVRATGNHRPTTGAPPAARAAATYDVAAAARAAGCLFHQGV